MAQLLFLIGWVMGVIIAQGFWSTALAVIIPLWAWYLTIEKLMQSMGVV